MTTRDFMAVFEAELRSTRSVESAVSAVVTSAQAGAAFGEASKLPGPAPRAPLSSAQCGWLVEEVTRVFGLHPSDLATGRTSAHSDARAVICAAMAAMGMSYPATATVVRCSLSSAHEAVRRARRPDLAEMTARVLDGYRREFERQPIEIRVRGQQAASRAA